MIKQIVIIGTAVMTTFLALAVIWKFRIAVIYLLLSLTLAAVLRPMVMRLSGRGFIVCSAWILLYLASLSSFGFLLFLTCDAAVNEIKMLASIMSVRDEWKLPLWLKGSAFQKSLADRLPTPSKLFEAFTGDEGQFVLPTILGFTQGIGGFVSGVLVILFLSIYWSINRIHFERLWLSLLPSEQRKQARDIWRTIETEIGAYVRSKVIQSLMAGLLLGAGYLLLRSPCPALLALAGALACLIPVVGLPLAVIPVLVAGLLISVKLSLLTALYAFVILIVMEIWVKPRLINRRWDDPILTVVLLIAMAEAFGIVGVIAAPPLSVVCQILWNHLVTRRTVSADAAHISDLRKRQARLLDTLAAMDEPHPALVISSMDRLTELIDKAEPILQTALPEDAIRKEPSDKFPSSHPAADKGESYESAKPETKDENGHI